MKEELTKLRDFLSQRGRWTTGEYFRDEGRRVHNSALADKFCLLGALDFLFKEPKRMLEVKAWLSSFLSTNASTFIRPDVLTPPDKSTKPRSDWGNLGMFNDECDHPRLMGFLNEAVKLTS